MLLAKHCVKTCLFAFYTYVMCFFIPAHHLLMDRPFGEGIPLVNLGFQTSLNF